MAAKKGLGKGIDSMIPPNALMKPKSALLKEDNKVVNGVESVSINKVEPNRNQPRKNFNEDSLIELSESIKIHGIIQPLIVARKEDYYEIIAGERRWRAAKLAGLKEVPIVIKDYSSQEIMEIALIENIQREDLNPIEEARAYQNLIKEYDLKQDDVAEKVSKSRTTITNALRLLKLDDRVQDMLVQELISSGHARALLSLADKDNQYELAMRILDEKMSVREVEKTVKNYNKPKPAPKEPVAYENDFVYTDLEEKIRQKVGTKVVINRKGNNKGKIEIDYYSVEELERIVGLFTEQ